MATIIYTLLATRSAPNFDLGAIAIPGGENLLLVQAVNAKGEVSEYSDAVVYFKDYSEYVIRQTTLAAITDSVRTKTKKTEPILIESLPSEIDTILVPKGHKEEPITQNGDSIPVAEWETVKVEVQPPLYEDTIEENTEEGKPRTPPEGYYGFSKVHVKVPIPEGYHKSNGKTKSITENSGDEPTSVMDTDGTFYPTVSVNVQPLLQNKTATKNNESVTADSGFYGLRQVDVNVPTADARESGKKWTMNNTLSLPSDGDPGLDAYHFMPCNIDGKERAGFRITSTDVYALQKGSAAHTYLQHSLYNKSTKWASTTPAVIEAKAPGAGSKIALSPWLAKWLDDNSVK